MEDSVQNQIGELAASLMEYAEEHGLAELTLGGVVAIGKTVEDTPLYLTRTSVLDPFACARMWCKALDMEIETAKRDVYAGLSSRDERIAELERQLEDERNES